MLAIEVRLLTGRYIATAFDDRRRAEWPPHPARLYSALAAGCLETIEPAEDELRALEWLEAQGPPEILASEAHEREVVTVFVPVNDTAVVPDLDDEARELAEAKKAVAALLPGGGKTLVAAEKRLVKAETRFRAASSRAVAAVPAGKEGKDGAQRAASLLPDRRGRQPRAFPSVTPESPRIVFSWPEADPSVTTRSSLDGLAARLVRLGHSSSFVMARVTDELADPTWIPDRGGTPGEETILRVVTPGQLRALAEAFSLQPDAPGRVLPAAFQRYVRPGTDVHLQVPTTVFGEDWLVLRRVDGPRLPSTRGVDVARTIRRALLAAHAETAPQLLSGHLADGSPSDQPHVAIVPLPYVGSTHADGSLLGVALVLPRAASGTEKAPVYRALAAWEANQRKHDEEDSPQLPIALGAAGCWLVERVQGTALAATLKPKTWCAASTTWASATPIALDRNPGDLRGRDPAKESRAYAEATETIATACMRIGLPRPVLVEVSPAAPLAGADKARAFPTFRTGKPGISRVLMHAKLTFAEKVAGPLLLGAGRYFGLGLFRPTRPNE